MENQSLVTHEDKGSKGSKTRAGRGDFEPGNSASCAAQLSENLAAGWRRGSVLAEDLLKDATDLADFPDVALLVVLEEIRRRREYGPPPGVEEYLGRFPQWANQLQSFFGAYCSTSESVESVVFPVIGEIAAGCRLVTELGRGAQGRVFLAAQTSLADRLVVLKMGLRDCHEHLALARLLHTHIVPLHFVPGTPGP